MHQERGSAAALDNERLAAEIGEVHAGHRGAYERPRIVVALRRRGHRVNHKRVGRVMREATTAVTANTLADTRAPPVAAVPPEPLKPAAATPPPTPATPPDKTAQPRAHGGPGGVARRVYEDVALTADVVEHVPPGLDDGRVVARGAMLGRNVQDREGFAQRVVQLGPLVEQIGQTHPPSGQVPSLHTLALTLRRPIQHLPVRVQAPRQADHHGHPIPRRRPALTAHRYHQRPGTRLGRLPHHITLHCPNAGSSSSRRNPLHRSGSAWQTITAWSRGSGRRRCLDSPRLAGARRGRSWRSGGSRGGRGSPAGRRCRVRCGRGGNGRWRRRRLMTVHTASARASPRIMLSTGASVIPAPATTTP
ncbi:IS3 family transposase [Saccharothrix texasensis]|uniref:IS3 family transposase n=1 Tax=Saccharothrix texasensis TaxID=103734 RepID=UPI000F4B0C49